jgi:2-keto-4-pentenoate hydratase/2-oxohepta-3-ene-1,7-dioic acid hydratase in catechol pathway
MKIVTFEVETALGRVSRLGALADESEDGRIVDLNAAFARHLADETDEPTPKGLADLRVPPDMIGWLLAGAEGMRAARSAIKFALDNPDRRGLAGERLIHERKDVRLLAPLPRPTSFRDFSIYEEHMTRAQITPMVGGKPWVRDPSWYTTPHYYKGSCTAIRGPEDPVPYPYYTKLLDLELEIGIVVGKAGRNLTVEQAAKHIAGYTILIDSSCRDGYKREPFGPTKRKDFHTAIGPCLVTADAIDAENLKCRIEVDGELWFEGSTSAPHGFTPAQLVAYASDNEDLYPGDLLGTGTVGFGCSMDIHKWIKVGQVATFWVENIGAMHLKVVKGEEVVRHVDGMQGLLKPPAVEPA